MKPYFTSDCGRMQIWWASCRDVPIPREAVAITDPPYNVGSPKLIANFKNRKNGTFQRTIGRDFGKDFDEAALLPSEWVKWMPNTVLSFYGAKRMAVLFRAFRKDGFEIVQDFHWCKTNAPPPLRAIGFAWGTESGYLFRRKGTTHQINKKAGYSPNFFVTSSCSGNERGIHSTQKPLTVMKWLVRFLTVPDALVVDPFMGSGSVGVACAELGRRFIGIEQKEEYCEIAATRIKSALVRYSGSFRFD